MTMCDGRKMFILCAYPPKMHLAHVRKSIYWAMCVYICNLAGVYYLYIITVMCKLEGSLFFLFQVHAIREVIRSTQQQLSELKLQFPEFDDTGKRPALVVEVRVLTVKHVACVHCTLFFKYYTVCLDIFLGLKFCWIAQKKCFNQKFGGQCKYVIDQKDCQVDKETCQKRYSCQVV